ncbi:hypothetical protein MADA3029_1070165 [Vibrio nigripulchritudo MADA3029]|uniref:hypothetical protein n=1 Tax=Vibrio nigripulchritudo TaxID=28173 RepID=UPI0003B18E91|nr:hypothetical protein [Vibrio nigripulchritudo]CCN47487.1 hypothetical protein VIBNIMADA3020_410034 [Vibrio nigripulchritudo MADA3020]CCN55893.1 hypothetical protein VIBNIMADA3021_840165 [Vibrio nigripulchritudo MADA3021]CCN57116.1 hypothetical protein MADA3029_1070165 [Vibrio nigripulchritudo MADA3029]
MVYAVTLMVILVCSLTYYVAKFEKKPLLHEFVKLTLSLSTLFLGVFLAQYSSNIYHQSLQTQHTIKLLRVTYNEVNDFNEFIQSIPSNYSQAKQQIYGYKPSDLFRHNKLEIPSIVNTTLSDTSIVRKMHPQSIASIFASLGNTKTSIEALNLYEISEGQLQSFIDKTSIHTNSLAKYLEFEIRFQTGDISEEELFDLHRAEIKFFEDNPVSSLQQVR